MSACDHLERALLADLLAPDAATRAHVANCADCAARLAGYERMAQALGEIGAAHARRPDHQIGRAHV